MWMGGAHISWTSTMLMARVCARAQMELTLMVQTLRPLALAPLRRALGYRMGLAMRGLPIKGEEDPERVCLDSLKATSVIFRAIMWNFSCQASCILKYYSGARINQRTTG